MSDNEASSPEKAREQAAEFLSVFAGVDFDLGTGVWHLPNPSYLPRNMKRRHMEYMRFINKDLDTEDIPVTDPITGRKSKRTQTVWPLSYKGALIDEDELLCIALMSDSEDGVEEREAYFKDGTLPKTYEQFLNAGGVAGQVQMHWRVMNLQMEERIKRDPKSR